MTSDRKRRVPGMMSRIACDLDGTLADMNGALQSEAEALFGPDVSVRAGLQVPAEPPSAEEISTAPEPNGQDESAAPQVENARRALTRRQYRQLWTHCVMRANFWSTLKEIEPGAVARFGQAARAHGWEVIFLTQRPPTAGELPQLQTQRWLQAHGFELPSVYVLNGSRGKVASALSLHAVIDDKPENCLDVVTDSTAKPILVWRDTPQSAPPAAARMGIETVFSFGAALDYLEALSVKPARSSLVDRIRETLGI